MNKKLYVGNLSYSITEESLRETFSECGTIGSVKLITDRETGRSKGFAFVEYADENDAQTAIEKFNDFSLDNRNMRVSIAKPQENRGGGGGRRFGGGGGGGNRGGYNSDRGNRY